MSTSDEFEVIESPLSQSFDMDGKSVQIDIYKGDNCGWTIEIVDKFNNSTVWEDEFSTDTEALSVAIESIRKEGIGVFIIHPA